VEQETRLLSRQRGEVKKRSAADDQAVGAAVRGGDELAFTRVAEGYRRQLQVHCYRMLGSLEDAEDLVQDTFLAWRARTTADGGGKP
jgi:RNA polymerase sigma-70 factor (ECF subfamily)